MHDSLCAYLATFAVFAGACVMVYPNDVFISTIGVNIQTMVCHGSMLTIGIFLLGSGYVKAKLKTILGAVAVFSSAVGIAVLMNELTVASGILNGIGSLLDGLLGGAAPGQHGGGNGTGSQTHTHGNGKSCQFHIFPSLRA